MMMVWIRVLVMKGCWIPNWILLNVRFKSKEGHQRWLQDSEVEKISFYFLFLYSFLFLRLSPGCLGIHLCGPWPGLVKIMVILPLQPLPQNARIIGMTHLNPEELFNYFVCIYSLIIPIILNSVLLCSVAVFNYLFTWDALIFLINIQWSIWSSSLLTPVYP